jgi:hypothetical protein
VSVARLVALTSLAMVAFAGNSLLCRVALRHTGIDAASFATTRLASGAALLWLIARRSRGTASRTGHWLSALALFAYAAGFSVAYVSLPAATGALLLLRNDTERPGGFLVVEARGSLPNDFAYGASVTVEAEGRLAAADLDGDGRAEVLVKEGSLLPGHPGGAWIATRRGTP